MTMTESEVTVLNVFMLEWHAYRVSTAFDNALIRPLSRCFDINEYATDWDGNLTEGNFANIRGGSHIYCCINPPLDFVGQSRCPVFWIPMWDFARSYSSSFWKSLPPNVHVLSYSRAVSERTRALGLKTLDVQYFCDPRSQPPTNWDGERVAFYWNRKGLVSPRFLEHWCDALRINTLLYKPQLDPFVPHRLAFDLPRKLGHTRVETVPHFANQADYFRVIEPVNIYLAPRPYEGIGLAFLEAMARGCAVFAFDGPTMSEYIQSGKTGYLFGRRTHYSTRALGFVRRPLTRVGFREPKPYFYVRDKQPWDEIAALDLPVLGRAAHDAHIEGYARWQASIPTMVDFIKNSVTF